MVKWSFRCDVGCSVIRLGSRLICGGDMVWAWCRASLMILDRVLYFFPPMEDVCLSMLVVSNSVVMGSSYRVAGRVRYVN
jgi:hypothetical protein